MLPIFVFNIIVVLIPFPKNLNGTFNNDRVLQGIVLTKLLVSVFNTFPFCLYKYSIAVISKSSLCLLYISSSI